MAWIVPKEIAAPPLSIDPQRLAALEALDIMDTPPEPEFDQVTALLKMIFDVEVAFVSMIDAHRVWYKSIDGASVSEAALDGTFCRATLESDAPVIVPDVEKDSRFEWSESAAKATDFRFYAGVPVRSDDGHIVGTLCALDTQPRAFSERDLDVLIQLSGLLTRILHLRQFATTDALTGALNRRAFREDAVKQIALARRHRQPLSCVSIDLDHFKTINDTYGHAAGDHVLAGTASCLKAGLRETDLLARMGGEEFVALLPQTDSSTALEVANRLRTSIARLGFPGSRPPIAVTASFGTAGLSDGEDLDGLLMRVDQALYEAKRTGRNRACIAANPGNANQVRRRVLKAATIVLDNGRSTLDCTVRRLWDGGAELTLPLPTSVPDSFRLVFKSSDESYPCRLTARSAGAIEATFVS
ncbi:GGDEF domain-containing protein [Devosia pacifica]|uniref:diguanylate cyclase n=1 Tax=Devosia pacifica TaxID=1335967 RepID=A0A918VXG1_9HYPH|nr:sensor domain-containing diguanylate cyclase [Devosia pacifica]GHA31447.1 GGDEF domain-containing protein [Devosia pacifica]